MCVRGVIVNIQERCQDSERYGNSLLLPLYQGETLPTACWLLVITVIVVVIDIWVVQVMVTAVKFFLTDGDEEEEKKESSDSESDVGGACTKFVRHSFL